MKWLSLLILPIVLLGQDTREDPNLVYYTCPFPNCQRDPRQTVDSKLSQIVSVKDFGVKGDGVTDDYAALTHAIAGAGRGGYILVPKGVYAISQGLVLGDGQTLDCQSGDMNRPTDTAEQGAVFLMTGTDWIIRNASLPPTTGVYGVRILNCQFDISRSASIPGAINMEGILSSTIMAPRMNLAASGSQIGILFDGQVGSAASYYNDVFAPWMRASNGTSQTNTHTCLKFANSANENHVYGGSCIGIDTGIDIAQANHVLVNDFAVDGYGTNCWNIENSSSNTQNKLNFPRCEAYNSMLSGKVSPHIGIIGASATDNVIYNASGFTPSLMSGVQDNSSGANQCTHCLNEAKSGYLTTFGTKFNNEHLGINSSPSTSYDLNTRADVNVGGVAWAQGVGVGTIAGTPATGQVITSGSVTTGGDVSVFNPSSTGSELSTDGNFATSPGPWTLDASCTISANALNCSSVGVVDPAFQTIALQSGKEYQFTYTISNYVSGTVLGGLFGSPGTLSPYRSANGTYTDYLVASATTNNNVGWVTGSGGFVGSISAFSFKLVTGGNVVANGNLKSTGQAVSVGTKAACFDTTGQLLSSACALQGGVTNIVSTIGPIDSTETILTDFAIPANTIAAGTQYRITAWGTATAGAANVTHFRVRYGTADDATDTILLDHGPTSSATGTNIGFRWEGIVTFRSTTISEVNASLMNSGTTGIMGVAGQVTLANTTGLATNVTKHLYLTFLGVAGGTPTTASFQNAYIELVKQ